MGSTYLAEGGDTAPLTQALEDAGVPADQIATIFGPDPTTPPPLTAPAAGGSPARLALLLAAWFAFTRFRDRFIIERLGRRMQ